MYSHTLQKLLPGRGMQVYENTFSRKLAGGQGVRSRRDSLREWPEQELKGEFMFTDNTVEYLG